MSSVFLRLFRGKVSTILCESLVISPYKFQKRTAVSFLLSNPNYNRPVLTTLHNQSILAVRWKSKKSDRKAKSNTQQQEDDDEDDEQQADEFEELLADKHTKLVKTSVSSLRADLILRAGLGIARNKIETSFYESKIRLNGKKLLKKSVQLDVGDEVDIVRGISPSNPDHLIVSRVEILSATPKTESISISLRRHKSLIIENYESDAVINE